MLTPAYLPAPPPRFRAGSGAHSHTGAHLYDDSDPNGILSPTGWEPPKVPKDAATEARLRTVLRRVVPLRGVG